MQISQAGLEHQFSSQKDFISDMIQEKIRAMK